MRNEYSLLNSSQGQFTGTVIRRIELIKALDGNEKIRTLVSLCARERS